ncbi:hypothetical protein B0I08_104144 [Glaciihabitans tibetensis]|uniref:Uncharacterized protein n=1 Tax=Glaciihabitans tibetensis TaxID=1266600 RepID=A0A2T0VE87_9MICO|nr:hypothetical protein [Glaciihabitans tibetensis]PRY68442.1 hypothetical protein B0I08_104144 [Glaciihabitans tibetensis]
MHISDDDPMDMAAPPTLAEVAANFLVPVMSFAAQRSLEELGAGATGHSMNGGPMHLDSVSVSYTLWRNPDDRSDPVNLAELSEADRAALEMPPVRPLPDWMIRLTERMRFPSLWEAVMTTRHASAELTLVEHVNHILTNVFREERVVDGLFGDLDSPVDERHIERVSVVVDGREVAGMRIDTDPHVYAVGADLGDRVLTVVVAREHLPYITLAFVTGAPPRS